MRRRKIIQERKLSVPGRIEASIEEQIVARGWKTLVSYPNEAYEEMTREFYSNAHCSHPTEKDCVSYVRGKLVNYDAATINDILKTKVKKGKDQWDSFNKGPVDPDLLLTKLCMPGTKWIVDKAGRPKKVASCTLLPVPKIWANFIITNLTPCSNKSDVGFERAKMIHAIMIGKTSDVGKIIQGQIQSIAKSSSKAWGFPHLITLLCDKAKVDKKGFVPLAPTSAIDLDYVVKHCGVVDHNQPKFKSKSNLPRCSKSKAKSKDGESSSQAHYGSQVVEPSIDSQNIQALYRCWEVLREDVLRSEDISLQMCRAQNIAVNPKRSKTEEEIAQYVGWTPYSAPIPPQENENEEEDESEENENEEETEEEDEEESGSGSESGSGEEEESGED